MIKIRECALLIVLIHFFSWSYASSTHIDRKKYYAVLASNNELEIDKMLTALQSESVRSEVNAYQATLWMKKANFEKSIAAKVKLFKKGALDLDHEIETYPENAEYRFLRLTIQEHAPAILKYNKQKEVDKKVIVSKFKTLDKTIRTVIEDYAASSKTLKKSELP